MILDVLLWLAVVDVIAAAVLAGLVYAIGRRSPGRVGVGRAIGLAVMLSLPAALLYLVAWLLVRVM